MIPLMFKQTSPSGVVVTSTVPFHTKRWNDGRALHIVWSYASWTTLILSSYGWKTPRVLFNRHWNQEMTP